MTAKKKSARVVAKSSSAADAAHEYTLCFNQYLKAADAKRKAGEGIGFNLVYALSLYTAEARKRHALTFDVLNPPQAKGETSDYLNGLFYTLLDRQQPEERKDATQFRNTMAPNFKRDIAQVALVMRAAGLPESLLEIHAHERKITLGELSSTSTASPLTFQQIVKEAKKMLKGDEPESMEDASEGKTEALAKTIERGAKPSFDLVLLAAYDTLIGARPKDVQAFRDHIIALRSVCDELLVNVPSEAGDEIPAPIASLSAGTSEAQAA